MTKYSRRQFLARMATASTFVLSGGTGLLGRVFAATDETRPFEFLVVGDSLIWGGGLREEHKFYTLTRNWLQTEVFAGKRPVNMKNKSHSGATLTLHADEAAALAKAGQDEGKYYPPEVNVSFPSAKKQIDMAAAEYGQGNLGNVDLIMISGGLTDISTAGILNPNGDNEELKRDVEKYCQGSMLEVLRRAGEVFPNAMIGVVGYFPILSPQTNTGKLFNGMLEAYGFPRFFKPVVNNPLVRPLVFKKMKKKAIVRSRIWIADSDLHLQAAVNKFNTDQRKPRAVFIKGPVTEENCFETPNTLLSRMGKKGRVDDALYAERKAQCNEALPELKKTTGIEYPMRFCEMASIGHPNIEGAKAYTESIKAVLRPVLERKTVN